MKLIILVVVVLFGTFLVACSSAATAPTHPMEATVEPTATKPLPTSTTSIPSPNSIDSSCRLTGGEQVQAGWSGRDTGNNFCNNCFCTNGMLGCTKMACTPKLSGPNRTDSPSSNLQTMVHGHKDSAIKVTIYNAEKVWPGTTLLSDHHDVDNPRIIEINMLGEVKWQYVLPEDFKPYTNPGQDVERLANGNTLLVMPGKGIVEISDGGEVVWSHMDDKVSHDADRLDNGNTLYAFGHDDSSEDAQAKEVTPDGELVWRWYAKDYFNKDPYVALSRNGWTHTNAVQRLENGNTLISPRNFDLLVEVDSDGSVVRTLGQGLVVDAHDPEFLSTGNILVANQVNPHEALEFNPTTNEIVWRYVPPYPQIANSLSLPLADAKPVMLPVRDVDSLPNGNVLITGYPFIIEVTRDGEIVWQVQYEDMESVIEGRSGLNKGPSYGFYKAQRISVTQ